MCPEPAERGRPPRALSRRAPSTLRHPATYTRTLDGLSWPRVGAPLGSRLAEPEGPLQPPRAALPR